MKELAYEPAERFSQDAERRGRERPLPSYLRQHTLDVEQTLGSCGDGTGEEAGALEYFSERLRLPPEEIDGWQIAQRLTKPGCDLAMGGMREYAERLAVRSVLERAAALVGPLRGATHQIVEPMREPHQGELELDETLENLLGKEFPERQDWLVEHREERRTQIVLMLDTSLSMAGTNIALAAVAAAVLALKMKPEDLSVVVFESTAEAVSHLEDADPPEHVVTEMLRQPCRGYTNIEDGLRTGLTEIGRGRNPRKYGLLITDGVYTRGGDPTALAARFPHLFVLLTEDYKMNQLLCKRMADVGRGELFRVRSLRELPRQMVDVADRLLR